MATAAPAYNPPLGTLQSTLSTYLQAATTALGISDYSYFFEEWYSDSSLPRTWNGVLAGSGAFTPVLAASGGAIGRFSTGASSGSASDANCSSGLAAVVSTAKWYVASRFRIQTAVDSVTQIGVGVQNAASNATIMVGHFGALSAANFIVQYDGLRTGSFVSLGVAADTNFHVFELYGVGTTAVFARIDGGALVTATQASAPADNVRHYITCRNGTTAANRNLDVDWYLSVGQRM